MLTDTPNCVIRCWKLSISARRGRLRRVSGSSVRSAQGMSVSAAFFGPETGIVPDSRLPPRMMILSMNERLAGIASPATMHRGDAGVDPPVAAASGHPYSVTLMDRRQPIRKAVFPVAGLGTRFLPATKAIPKELLPIVDRPLIQYAVDEARDAGI